MSTWVGAIVETVGRADFWNIARKHGVDATTQEIQPGHDSQTQRAVLLTQLVLSPRDAHASPRHHLACNVAIAPSQNTIAPTVVFAQKRLAKQLKICALEVA